MSAEWPPTDDPLFDPDDPAAVEREERRREREEKRRQREAKKGKKAPPPPPPEKPPAPPVAPRTPEQEFWDEDPTPAPPVPGQEPAAPGTADPAAPDPGMVERGRRRLLGRRRAKQPAPQPTAPAPVAPEPPKATAATGADGAAPNAATKDPQSTPAEPKTKVQPQSPASPPKDAPSPVASSPDQPAPTPAHPDQTSPSTSADSIPPKAPSPDPDKSQVDPTAAVAGGAAATAKPAPSEAAATPPEGDPLGEPAPGGAAAAGLAAAADPEPPATGPPAGADPTGEHPLPPSDPGPATGEHRPAPGDPASGTREYAAPPPPPEEPNTGDWHPLERDWDFHDEGDPEMTGAARGGRRRGEDGGNRRGGVVGALLRHPFRILAVIVALVVLWFLNGLFQPFHGDGHGRVAVTIPKGAGVGEVGDILEKRGVIDGGAILDASTLFQMRVTLAGKRGDLFAGHFGLQKEMSYGAAIDALSKEPSAKTKPGITTVTIPEGYSRPLAAQLVKEDGVPGSYLKASKRSKVLNPAKYGGKGAKNLEGFLFPDTFELKPNAPAKDLVELQLQDFKKKIKKVDMKYANSKNLTIFDVLTIASMIEREAGVPKQRKLVASVIYNRLHDGMTLGIDSTIRFATGNYEKPLTESQLESESPYNTRNHAGLPPGPINSPGLAALNAAAHPAKTDYLFYVNNPSSCNELTFAKTEEEFLADAAKYEKAREANGGNQPTTCK
jgi:UPF0755 protein